jgi:FkbM family methyltransferase
MKKIIYDFGASRGENIPYYLLKSDLVVAVEADPENYNFIKKKFQKEIENKKLFIENCILGEENNIKSFFYKHKSNHLLGQFPKPSQNDLENFLVIELPSKDVVQIIKTYGDPYYIKIDVEQYDEVILKKILSNNIFPDYISVEGTHQKIFDLLYDQAGYSSFKLVEGNDVEYLYRNTKIMIGSKIKNFSFIQNSAGPFGNDIHGEWLSKENFTKLIEFKKFGWRDIHCSNIDLSNKMVNFEKYINIEKKRKKKTKLLRRFFRLMSKLNFLKRNEG